MAYQLTPQISIPNNQAKAGWDFDGDSLDALVKAFGIEAPIVFRYSSGNYRLGAWSARVKDGRIYHHITISQIQPLWQAMQNVLHELTHAKQAEDYARRTGNSIQDFVRKEYFKYSGASFSKSYLNNPYEVEARRNGETLYSQFPVLYS